MPMLKTIQGHTRISRPGSSSDTVRYLKYGNGERGIERYLTHDSRSLATDLINMPLLDADADWGRAMDETRIAFGNDGARKGSKARTYMHFVLSPDPRDSVTIDRLRELACAWAERMFGAEDPAICCAQVAIEYHDDNKQGIPHAHIVVNNTDLDTGKKMHISRAQYAYLTDELQKMAEERGLRYFAEDGESKSLATRRDEALKRPSTRRDQPQRERTRRYRAHASRSRRYSTIVEDNLRNQENVVVWKDELRFAIEAACNIADDVPGAIAILRKSGIKVEERHAKSLAEGEDFIFYYPQEGVPAANNTKRVSGQRLGRAYTAHGMADQIRTSYYRKLHSADRNPEGIMSVIASIETVRYDTARVTMRDLSRAFDAIDEYQIASIDDARNIAEREVGALSKLEPASPEAKRKQRLIGDLRTLVRIAPHCNILPATREQSKTIAAAKAKGRAEDAQHVPLLEKVSRGYRLSKAEYEKLKRENPAAFALWQDNRKKRSAGLPTTRYVVHKKGDVGSSGTSRGSGATPTVSRSRGAR